MAVNRSGSIKVQGLKELRAELKTLEDPKALEDELKDVHYRIAVKIETGAGPRLARIKGGMGAAAENTLSARKSVTGAQIEEILKRVYAMPPDLIARAIELGK